jgi:hypothetical protein
VRVNGLAVRTGPGATYPFVAGYRVDTEVLITGEVRVDDGSYLWIEDGPLVINGVPWYHVTNTLRQTDQASDELLVWDADGDEFRSDSGWVAGGDGASSFLVADEPPPPPPDTQVFGGGPSPFALMSGLGNGTSEPFQTYAPVGAVWYAADPGGQECDLTVTLQPDGVDMGSDHVQGWGHGDEWWPRDGSVLEGDHWLEILSDCSWSLRAHPIQG